MKFIVSTKGV
ncbi:2a0eff95-3db4-4a2b-b6c1-6cbaa5298915 [Thermothielavioides terrestris]|uniref:2a0eff95-3db4-4a2b-b6c1-6cbaa5298915 n=1 Tax=Thermothielavioides terrestris TaxID=2587410 RepID=A0A3S5CXM1_9PEZI|nr:2a0eff95-3db4-4a2b-b6c1-6cbaa5298915 [Thermothielavioides terrestris]